MFVFAKQEATIEKVKKKVSTRIRLKDLRRPKQILGKDCSRKLDGSLLKSPTWLITEILNDMGMKH